MAKKKAEPVPILKVRKNATNREILAAAREAFTADDLQKFTEIDEGIPFEQVLTEMEAIRMEQSRKLAKKRPTPKAMKNANRSPRNGKMKADTRKRPDASVKKHGMAKKPSDDKLILKVRKNATDREIYDAYRKQFTAADLQKYTELDEGIPAAKVIAQLEAIQRKYEQKQQRKRK